MPRRETASSRPGPPTGWRRLVARLPVLLFRAGLGGLAGKRMLLLHHVGRVSGRDRVVVLEVVSHDPAGQSWVVASGFGPGSDWYRNLREQPQTVLQFGNRLYAVTAQFLPSEAGADVMADYARRYPGTARRLCSYLGLPSDGSEASFRTAGEAIPFVRLQAADVHRHDLPDRTARP